MTSRPIRDRLVIRFGDERRYHELRAVRPTAAGHRAVCGRTGTGARVVTFDEVAASEWPSCRDCDAALGRARRAV